MSREEPIISVIMPSYNHEKFLSYAINSVLLQKISELELIIIDDFSKDNSRKIIREWTSKDHRVRALFHDKNEGVAKTCNEGIINSNGKYIVMMASDDAFKPNAFEKILSLLYSSQNYDGVILEGECIDSENRTTGLLFSDVTRKPSKPNLFEDLIEGNFVCSGFVNKSILIDHEILYDENLRLLNDWLFWLDLAYVSKLMYIQEPLYEYRLHGPITSRCKPFAEDHLKARDMILKKYGSILDRNSKIALEKNAEASYRKCLNPSPVDRLYRSFISSHSSVFRLYNRVRKNLSTSKS